VDGRVIGKSVEIAAGNDRATGNAEAVLRRYPTVVGVEMGDVVANSVE
jgi:hypothetical protein